MNLEFKRFDQDYYPEYASWFADADLNRHLGPMDYDWLEAILSEAETKGATWAVFQGGELVAVGGIKFDTDNQLVIISEIAVKPTLRRQGIGTAVLKQILSLDQKEGFYSHLAYISLDNQPAQHCMEKIGFRRATSTPNEQGYLEYRYESSGS